MSILLDLMEHFAKVLPTLTNQHIKARESHMQRFTLNSGSTLAEGGNHSPRRPILDLPPMCRLFVGTVICTAGITCVMALMGSFS